MYIHHHLELEEFGMKREALPEGQHQEIHWYIGVLRSWSWGKQGKGWIHDFLFHHCLAQCSQYLQKAKGPNCMEAGYSAIQQQQMTGVLQYL